MNKLISFAFIFLSICTAQASHEILRNADGSIRFMYQHEAAGFNPDTGQKEMPDVCEANGKGHLPTVRELAEFSNLYGAYEILETNIDIEQIPAGYYKIISEDFVGKDDLFYFYSVGYNPPDLEIYNNSFWSSSYYEPAPKYLAYALNGQTGAISYSGRYLTSNAVLCFSGQRAP